MARLTEKEWTVESGLITADFYAELRNGIVSQVYLRLSIDGFYVTWNIRHQHSMICVYEIGKLTQDWVRFLGLVGDDKAAPIEKSLQKFLNDNLTFKN